MTAIPITQIYDYLASVFGKETAEKLITFLEQKINKEMENKSQSLATKADLQREVSRLDLRITEVNNGLTTRIGKVEIDLTKEIANVKSDLMTEIGNVRANLIMWMFIFWIGQAGISIGLILHFLKR